MTVADVATVLKLNQQTVRNWIDAGTLPAVRVGRRVRIRRSDFDAFVDQPVRRFHGGYSGEQFWAGELHPGPEHPVADDDAAIG